MAAVWSLESDEGRCIGVFMEQGTYDVRRKVSLSEGYRVDVRGRRNC